ncbi:MAG: hypothetical protein VCD34_02945 [Planctomycetota bacterium]
MAAKKRYGSRRPVSRRYGAARGGSGDKTLFYCIIGGVIFVFGLFSFVVVNSTGSDPESVGTLAGNESDTAPKFRRLGPPDEAAALPPQPVPRQEAEPEREQGPPPEEITEPEPVEPVVVREPQPAVPPEVIPSSREPVKKPPLPAAREVRNTVFSMLVTGRLGPEKIAVGDIRTWSRIGYFLQHEAAEQHWLEFPNPSRVPVIKKEGEKKKAEGKGKKFPDGYPSLASRKKPGHRLVIHVSTSFDGDIEFSGTKTGSKYSCRLDCSLEERKGNSFQSITSFSVKTKTTPAKVTTSEDGDPGLLREVYSTALEELCLELLGMKPFKS